MNCLVWFRHDLRIVDQPALDAALNSGSKVHAIVLLSPAIWQQHGWGTKPDQLVHGISTRLRTRSCRHGYPTLH